MAASCAYELLSTPSPAKHAAGDSDEELEALDGRESCCCPLRRWMLPVRRAATPALEDDGSDAYVVVSPRVAPTPVRRRPQHLHASTPLIVDELEHALGTGIRPRAGDIELSAIDDSTFIDQFFPVYPPR